MPPSQVKSVLAVFAHPDDEVLGAGATLARYVRESHVVNIAILGEGATSRHVTRESALDSSEIQAEMGGLQSSIHEAAKAIGAKDVWTGQLPDNRFDSLDLLDIVKLIEELKTRFRPDTVFTHHPGDMNIDHGIVTNAVATAFRSLPEERPCQLLACEVLSSTDYSAGLPGRAFEPNVWVSVSQDDLDCKQTAMLAYDGELRQPPHPRSQQSISDLAKYRGAQCGTKYAEAFRLLRRWSELP